MKDLNSKQIENMIKTMSHEEIRDFRKWLEYYKNPNYLLRILYYDYDLQTWI